MATTYGPERPVEAVEALDNANSQILTSPQPSPRPPLPNPPFVFPARNPASAPSSYSRATGRRPKSAIESVDASLGLGAGDVDRPLRSPALPDFSFNPGALLPPDSAHLSPPLTPLSPHSPLSPQSPRAIPSPSRPGGHRRGGSEYVGGSIRDGDTIMSTSPTKSEGGFSSPTFQPPPIGRRGRHAHRRSAAISSHDLSIILQPTSANAALRGSSAPTSPADFDRKESPSSLPERILKPVESEPILKKPIPSTPVQEEEGGSGRTTPQPPRPTPRARVGFAETVEFIPRPLSLVSSDTSSTMTARPGHSVSGSISSVVSANTPVSIEKEPPTQPEMSPSRERSESRPSTAGAILERTPTVSDMQNTDVSPRRRNSIPTLRHMEAAAAAAADSAEPSPTKTTKRWSFFGLEPFIASNPQNRSRPVSSSSAESTSKAASSTTSSCEHVSDSALDDVESRTSYPKRVGKKATKKKKVKTWAGSILTRRAKPRTKKAKSSCHDVTTTGTGETESEEQAAPPHSDLPSDATPTILVPPGTSEPTTPLIDAPGEEDSSYPVIDLDAALGPFNTPLPHNPEWEAAQRAAGNMKRQLHSAQGMKGFSGPGMHYHRRAESAPEMVPFEGAKFGIHRFGSSSTMADVFEEEEEEEDRNNRSPTGSVHKDETAQSSDGDATPPAVALPSSAPTEVENGATQGVIRRIGSGLSDTDKCQPIRSVRSEHSTNSLQDEVIHEDPAEVSFQTSNIFDNSPSNSATPSPRRILAGRELAPVEISPLQLPAMSHAPVSPYSMSHGSSFPSPRSPISIDAQRISTAPSSVNDETNFQSLLLGQPGPEVRISVDDIPSLTSSNSTMTRESGYTPNQQHAPHAPFQSQRPASVSSAAFGRRRSSLASLSRLISSSHGERSKLSMEVSCETESERAKVSKTKRLSRMMQFWKPKESASN